MRGRQTLQGGIFSYVSLESRIPEDHPLRAMRRLVDTALKRLSRHLDAIYARGVGRPSVPPEQLLRALLLQVLYTIRSERQLVEQLEYNLLYRWFVGLELDDVVFSATVFTKNRNRLLKGEIAQHFFDAVLEQAEAGYDFVKVHPGLTRAEFDAAVEAGVEGGIDLAGHVSVTYGVGRALEARQATIDHLDGYVQYLIPPEADHSGTQAGFYGVNLLDLIDEDRITQVARETRDAGVWNVPTQSLIEHRVVPETSAEIARRPEMAYMPPSMIQNWIQSNERMRGTISSPSAGNRLLEIRQRLIKALHDEGAGLLLGSDAPQVFNVPGFSIHRDMERMVEAGMSPYQVIASGTRAVGEYFSNEDDFGTISVGARADLAVLNEADQVVETWIDGRRVLARDAPPAAPDSAAA